ncbi:unnamed protein product, partial [Staurois parvus]
MLSLVCIAREAFFLWPCADHMHSPISSVQTEVSGSASSPRA